MTEDFNQPGDGQDRDRNYAFPHQTAAISPATPLDSWRHDLRLLLVMAGPNIAGTVAQTVMSMTDFAIVSALGPAAQAAVSSGGLVIFSIFGLLMGTMICVNTVVSQSFGAGRLRDCSAYAWQGIWISILFGAGSIPIWLALPVMFDWIGHDPDVQTIETSYTQIRLLSVVFMGAAIALGNFFIGIHRPKHDAISVIVATVVNAVTSYGLVFGTWGLPRMGVDGAAWGTVIASMVRMIWLLWIMCLGPASRLFESRHTCSIDQEKIWRLLRVGWPSGVSWFLDITAWATFMVVIIGKFGTAHIAATATCWRYTELSFMPAVGIGIAVTAIVGKAIGEGRNHLARRRAAIGSVINMGYMGFMAAIFVIWGRELMDVFSNDTLVITIGTRLMIFAAVFQLFDAIAITYGSALRGAGDTFWPGVVISAQSWGIMIGGGVLIAHFRPELGSNGPWIFATLYVISIGLTLWFRWHRGGWERLDVIGRKKFAVDESG